MIAPIPDPIGRAPDGEKWALLCECPTGPIGRHLHALRLQSTSSIASPQRRNQQRSTTVVWPWLFECPLHKPWQIGVVAAPVPCRCKTPQEFLIIIPKVYIIPGNILPCRPGGFQLPFRHHIYSVFANSVNFYPDNTTDCHVQSHDFQGLLVVSRKQTHAYDRVA